MWTLVKPQGHLFPTKTGRADPASAIAVVATDRGGSHVAGSRSPIRNWMPVTRNSCSNGALLRLASYAPRAPHLPAPLIRSDPGRATPGTEKHAGLRPTQPPAQNTHIKMQKIAAKAKRPPTCSGVSPLLQEAPAPCQVKAAAAHKLVFTQERGGALLMPEMAVERDIDDLPRNDANYAALTPLWFLERAALAQPDRASVVHGPVRYTWADTYSRCRRLASALARRFVGNGSTVAVIAPNIPAVYEAHFGVPMAGAVVNCVNIRLNAATVAFLLEHSSAEVVMVDQEFFTLTEESLKIIAGQMEGAFRQPLIIVIGDPTCDPAALRFALSKGAIEYEKFLETGDPEFAWKPPQDEWKSIALGYTSGTTSNPKGVVLHHRGAYLMSLSSAIVWGMNEGAVYLWTLPMFHCNGWCYTWSLAALCGTSICLRQVSAKAIFSAIANQGVTHFCGAPVVLNTIINASPADTILPLPRVVNVMTAGAAPPPSVLAAMSKLGFRITHTYGLSETYGPSTVCAWKPEWDSLPADERALLHARQGIRYVGLEGLDVVDPKTMTPVPADGTTMGEIVMRGNGVMKGYLKNPKANAEAFENGWFHSGDLGVRHSDGYIEVKDRAKDIIISGGENISSLEVEKVVYQHPAVLEASVVARADEQWGESPCAFVTLKDGVDGSDEAALARDLMRFCRERMPGYWVPKSVVFGPLPKTATGKIKKHELRAKAKELGPVRKSSM